MQDDDDPGPALPSEASRPAEAPTEEARHDDSDSPMETEDVYTGDGIDVDTLDRQVQGKIWRNREALPRIMASANDEKSHTTCPIGPPQNGRQMADRDVSRQVAVCHSSAIFKDTIGSGVLSLKNTFEVCGGVASPH